MGNVFNEFHEAYASLLYDLLYLPENEKVPSRIGTSSEITGYRFTLRDPNGRFVMAPERKFRDEFAEKFFQWIWSGDGDMSKMMPHNPNTPKYMDDDMTGRNTAYGPRLVEQRDRVVEELLRDPYSRRASIMILYPNDSQMLLDSWQGKTKQEFPCTIALQFLMRGGFLDLHAIMRSNNAVTTLCYDVYNFTRIQVAILNMLREKGSNLVLGKYHHFAVSMHLFDSDREMAEKIVDWYIQKGILKREKPC